jgi:dTDP-4-dehydrorhamnose reductase
MKRDAEVAVLEATRDTGLGVVLRVPVLYGPAEKHNESAVNVILDAVENAKDPNASVKMDNWAQRYPTNTEDVGRVCNDIAVRYIKQKGKVKSLPKILQFSSEDRMTKYEMAQKFAQILDVQIPGMIANKEGNDPRSPIQRPFDTKLSTKELRDLGINIRTQDFDTWW